MSIVRRSRVRGRRWALPVFALLLGLAGTVAALPPRVALADTSLMIRVHQCPDGYVVGADMNQNASTCQIPGAGIQFTIEIPGLSPIVANTDSNGWIQGSIHPGQSTITSAVPQNWSQLIFCSITNGQLTQTPWFILYPDQTQFTTFDGDYLQCDWFVAAPAGPSSALVNKLNCSAGFDIYSASLNDLAQNCQEGGRTGIAFTLNDSQGGSNVAITDDNGFASWNNVPPGDLSIVEEMPDGYDSARVFCKQRNASTNDETSEDEVALGSGPTASLTLQAGWDLYCDWFNGNTSGVRIEIYKHGCPQDFDWTTADLNTLYQNCAESQNGISFSLSGQNTGNPGGGQTGDSGDSALIFPNLQADTLTINEDVPQGYDAPVVYCQLAQFGGGLSDPFPVDIENGHSITVQLDPGSTLVCQWFNVWPYTAQPTAIPTPAATVSGQPSGPATLVIIKRTCKKGFDPLDPDADVKADCATKTDGVDFELADEDGNADTATTGDEVQGEAHFENIDPGEYLLTEDYPSGVNAAFIRTCSSDIRDFSDYPFAPFAMIGASGSIWIELQPGETLKCAWYDLPAKTSTQASGATGSVTVTTLDCPGASANPANCEPAAGGIGFQLVPQDGNSDSIDFETDADGIAQVDVPAGSYDLVEQQTEWCFASSDAFDQDSYLVVNAGDAVEVTVYNCAGA